MQPRAAFRTPQKTAKYGVMTAADFNAPPAAIPLPPVDRWNPQSCGDSAMRIAADGTWFHEGEKITRPELVGLFAGLLRKGAAAWHASKAPTPELVDTVFMRALGRRPTPAEKAGLVAELGANPSAQTIEDLLWMVLLLPEFQFVR